MPVVNIVKGTGQSIFEPGQGSVLLVNSDTVNTVWVSPLPSVHATDIPIPPQASVTLDGTIRYFGDTITDVGPVAISVFPGGIAYSPGPPPIQSRAALITGFTTAVIFTFPRAGRIWGVELSYSIATTASYSGGAVNVDSFVICSGTELAQVVAVINAPGQSVVSNSNMSFNGFAVPAGAVVALSNPVTIPAGANQTSCGVLFYSIP